MNVLNCADGTYTMSTVESRTQRVTTFAGIEFFIDGRLFRDFVVGEEGRPLANGDVSVFNSGVAEPAGILLGAPFEPELNESGRAPILMCQCGNPYCGALMARIVVADLLITWTDWAWDRFLEPWRPIANIADLVFDLTQYTDELVNAEARSVDARPVAVVEVRETSSFVDFLFPQRENSARLDLRKRLTELHARPITPSLVDAEGEYGDFLGDLAATQALVTGWHSKGSPRTDRSRAAAIEGLSGLLTSPFVERLPDVTISAMEWFLADLRGRPSTD